MAFASLRHAFHALFDSSAPALWPTLNTAKENLSSFDGSLLSVSSLLPEELVALAELRVMTDAIASSAIEVSGTLETAADNVAQATREAARTVSGSLETAGLLVGLSLSAGATLWALYAYIDYQEHMTRQQTRRRSSVSRSPVLKNAEALAKASEQPLLAEVSQVPMSKFRFPRQALSDVAEVLVDSWEHHPQTRVRRVH